MLKVRLGAAALMLSVLALLCGCGVAARLAEQSADAAERVASAGRTGRATTREMQWARTAWRYFENNTDPATGLVGGMDRTPVFTIWNAGDTLAALVAARELGVIDEREFDLRTSRLLGFLANMDLSGGALPHKAYNALTGKMVNFENRQDDIGWSAVDTGRLMLWLKITGQRHPRFREYTDKVVLRWAFCEVIDDCGKLTGASRSAGQTYRYQEGRLGYEQLAGAGFAAWGFDARISREFPATETVRIYGLPVRHDARDPRATGVPAPALTMPHVLMGMELGWDDAGGAARRQLAGELYQVQEERWRREHQFTARTDYQMREAPYVVLDSVFAAGYPWNTIGSDGKEYEKLAIVSTRAAFGMWALWPGAYTDRLIESVQWLYDMDRGWYEGRLEAGGQPLANITLATNAAVLETLLFKAKGPLYAREAVGGFFQAQTSDVFRRLNRCLPGERPACQMPPPGR